ncbi:hypothetical protein [Dyadobacter aurulentus]|uniref:hypothetical protein n=1 Tax=Dyadobacter sp. UC 10 TaxID=2605428 RepID=UPI0011F2F6C1|nr:hypothetical protein [Dyadobacter sp. UC 10]KAA0989237.1 hypothetical protein FXO21_03215 [Dyadobacter sp. UC 10]
MMRYIILALLLIFNKACNGQKKAQMERFDITNFKKKAVKGEHIYITEDKIKVRQWQSSSEVFIQESSGINSTELLYQEFYSDSGFLKLSGKEFHGFSIGLWKEFSRSGMITKEWNEDEGYEFTIEELDVKMKALGVNIRFLQSGVSVMKAKVGRPEYVVTYPVDDNPYEVRKLSIDGITGQTLTEEIVKIRH